MSSTRAAILPIALSCFLASIVVADVGPEDAHSDIEFLAIGKAANYRQHQERLVLLNYHFYAEIFKRPNGHVQNAYLLFPPDLSRKEEFEDLGDMLKVKGGRYTSLDEMQAVYPDGVYRFTFITSGSERHNRQFTVGAQNSEKPIPTPITIRLFQRGLPVPPEQVDPELELTIRWTPFLQGKSDPNGIIDDMIFVSVTDCRGAKVAHSGRAFGEQGAYTFRNTEFVVSDRLLRPGLVYPIFVEHVMADTSREMRIPGMVANATTTFLDLRTTGEAKGESCPDTLPQMEPGQTDRPGPSLNS